MGDQAAIIVMSEERLREILASAIKDAIANSNGVDGAEYMTLEQVAELLCVTTRTVRMWVKDDGLPALRAGHVYRFRRESVVVWLEQRTTKPGAHISKAISRLNRAK